MRHGKKINALGRKSAHRQAMLSNMACSLIMHKRINTTVPKAKALRTYVEPLITKSKTDDTHSRRVVFGYLQDKDAVTELFREVGPKVGDRPGGYTRIIKTGFRPGDGADTAMIELVDYNELYTAAKPEKKTRRSRRRGGKKSAEAKAETEETTVEETAVEETPEAEVKTEEEVIVEEPEKLLEDETPEAEVKDEAAEEKPANEDEKSEDA